MATAAEQAELESAALIEEFKAMNASEFVELSSAHQLPM